MEYPRRTVGFHSSDLTTILAKLNEISTLGTPDVKALVDEISVAVRKKLDELKDHGVAVQLDKLNDSMVSDKPADLPIRTLGGKSRRKRRRLLKHAKKTAKG
jgi:hypothetical protein